MSKLPETINVEYAFQPELRTAQQDLDNYIASRPAIDEAGHLHDPVSGKFINRDTANSYYHDDTITEADEYQDMTLGELAHRSAEAEFYGDKTTLASVDDYILDKIDAMGAHDDYAERDGTLRDKSEVDNIYDNVLKLRENKLAELFEEQQPSVVENVNISQQQTVEEPVGQNTQDNPEETQTQAKPINSELSPNGWQEHITIEQAKAMQNVWEKQTASDESNEEVETSLDQSSLFKELYEKLLDDSVQEFMITAEYRKLNELDNEQEAMQSSLADRILSLNDIINETDGLSPEDKEHHFNLMAEFLKETDPSLKEDVVLPEPTEVKKDEDEEVEPIIIDDLPPIVMATPDGPVVNQSVTAEKKRGKSGKWARTMIVLGALGVGGLLGYASNHIGSDKDATPVEAPADENEMPSESGVDLSDLIDEIDAEQNGESADDSDEPSVDSESEEVTNDSEPSDQDNSTDAETAPSEEQQDRINQVIEEARASSALSQFAGLNAGAIQTTGDVWPDVNLEAAGATNRYELNQIILGMYNQAFNRNFVYEQDGMFWEGNSVINPEELAQFNLFTNSLVEEANK